MEIICERVYGEPKLKKPKFLKNDNLVGSVRFNEHCKNKLWKVEDTYYMLCRDWFSKSISLEEAKKVFNRATRNKFVYNDSWGEVVLRNEALISFTREDWQLPTCNAPDNLCIKLENTLRNKYNREFKLSDYWNRMFEETLSTIGSSVLDTKIKYKEL